MGSYRILRQFRFLNSIWLISSQAQTRLRQVKIIMDMMQEEEEAERFVCSQVWTCRCKSEEGHSKLRHQGKGHRVPIWSVALISLVRNIWWAFVWLNRKRFKHLRGTLVCYSFLKQEHSLSGWLHRDSGEQTGFLAGGLKATAPKMASFHSVCTALKCLTMIFVH